MRKTRVLLLFLLFSFRLCYSQFFLPSLIPSFFQEKKVSSWKKEDIHISFVPRTILALYDSKRSICSDLTNTHKFFEFPLNHLGLVVQYHDIQNKLPPLHYIKEIRGILLSFPSDHQVERPLELLHYLHLCIENGKKIVVIGNLGMRPEEKNSTTPESAYKNFFRLLGVQSKGEWQSIAYDLEIKKKNILLIDYERAYGSRLPPFRKQTVISKKARSHLQLSSPKNPQRVYDLVVTHPNGGIVAQDYALYQNFEEESEMEFFQWHINPFEFFRIAFAADDLPKADSSTEAGRRIYYSHIDGDGWNNLSQIERYQKKRTLSSEVVFLEAIIPYPDLPVTAAPIAADLDPLWMGSSKSLDVAKSYLSLPQVEIGSHTYSHPFSWNFFLKYHKKKERPFLPLYPHKSLSELWKKDGKEEKKIEYSYLDYETPRAYAIEPFNLKKEIDGSIRFIEKYLPKEKKVECFQWSGDSRPFNKALSLVKKRNLSHINGGDSRYDLEYPSIAWVSPLGRQVGENYQVYASNSNENTYTFLWTDRFYGHELLKETLENTESPIRFKPHNLYYHFYSGEKSASLQALLKNISYAKRSEIAPIKTSEYCKIASDFPKIKIEFVGKNQWRIHNRRYLNTIRFDQGVSKGVDFSQSIGIIGQRHYQGCLYVYLDRSVKYPKIALKTLKTISYQEPQEEKAYLIHSRWPIEKLKQRLEKTTFQAQGFGKGEMLWSLPEKGKYLVKANAKNYKYTSQKETDERGILSLQLPETYEKVYVSLTRSR